MYFAPFKFCVTADTHNEDAAAAGNRYYRQILSIYEGEPADSPSKLRDALEQADSDNCEFIGILGDARNHSGANSEFDDFLAFIDEFGIDRHIVLGNHDFPSITRATWLAATGKSGAGGVAYYSFTHSKYHFIVMDFNYDSNGDPYDTTYSETRQYYFPTAERSWLISDLDDNKDKITFVFTHQKASTSGEKMGDAFLCLEEADGDAFRAICENHGRVAAVFQAHAHKSDYSRINGIYYYTLMGAVDGDGDVDPADGIFDEGASQNSYAIVSIDSNGFCTITPYADCDDQSKWTTTLIKLGGNMPGQLKITIDYSKVSATLTNHPVLITEENIPSNFWNYVAADGSDIWVQGEVSNEMTVWDSELAFIDVENEKLELWVKVPSLSHVADTIFYLNYGDTGLSISPSTGVWDANFMTVHHMNGDPGDSAPEFIDSTANDNDGTAGAALTSGDLVDGPFGKSIKFDYASNNDINLGQSSDFDLGTGDFTFECLFKPQGFNGTHHFQQLISMGKYSGQSNDGGLAYSPNNEASVKCVGWQDSDAISPVLDTSTWYYLAAVRTSGDVTIYLNAVDISGSDTENGDIGVDSTAVMVISSYHDSDNYQANAYIAEVRVSDVARSADYLETTYNNMLDPSNFYSAEEHMIPYSDYAVSTANMITAVRDALDVAMPANPTADSPNDIIEKIKTITGVKVL